MPAPLAVNWDAVAAHAKEHGVREAARAYDLSENTVMARSRREGWLELAGVPMQELPKSMQPDARGARITPLEAVNRTHATLSDKTRSRFARGLARGALKVAHMRGKEVIARASEVKALVDASAKLHGWDQQNNAGAVLNLSFLQVCGTPAQAEPKPVEHTPTLDLPEHGPE